MAEISKCKKCSGGETRAGACKTCGGSGWVYILAVEGGVEVRPAPQPGARKVTVKS